MKKLYSKDDETTAAFIVMGGEIKINWGDLNANFPGDNIVVGTIEYFLQTSLDTRFNRLFDLSLSAGANYKTISFSQVEEMMVQEKFGYNTNIFLARTIEFFTSALIAKSKIPLGNLGRYQREAAMFSNIVDLLLDFVKKEDIFDLENIIREKRKLEVYKDGSLHSHFQPIEAISSPGKDRSKYIKFYKKNSQICREGSEGRDLYILLDGSVCVSSENLFVTNISSPGEAIGEMSFFLNKKRTATLTADEDTNLYIIPYTQLANFTKKRCPRLFYKLAQGLSLRLSETLQRIARLENLQSRSKLDEKSSGIALENSVKLELATLKDQIKEYILALKDSNVKDYLRTFLEASN